MLLLVRLFLVESIAPNKTDIPHGGYGLLEKIDKWKQTAQVMITAVERNKAGKNKACGECPDRGGSFDGVSRDASVTSRRLSRDLKPATGWAMWMCRGRPARPGRQQARKLWGMTVFSVIQTVLFRQSLAAVGNIVRKVISLGPFPQINLKWFLSTCFFLTFFFFNLLSYFQAVVYSGNEIPCL